MPNQAGLWIGFNLFVLALLALDLGVFHRKSNAVSVREALIWSAVWIGLALVFGAVLYAWRGPDVALQFFTGYLIEKTLSIDNLFVFVVVFGYFAVPDEYRHKVLFWGIVSALLMRALLIWVGAELLHRFHWTLYVFGGFLVLTGIRMAFQKDESVHPERNPLVRLFRRLMPVTEGFAGDRFRVRREGRRWATPLLITLLVVEFTDLMFALDSIPAIFAVTADPFIVYTSNVFAILGLRSLFFALAGVIGIFHYLKVGLSVVLVFVGSKMLVAEVYPIPILVSLGVVAGIIGVSIAASLVWPKDGHRRRSAA